MTTDAELLDIVAPLADRLERIAVALEAIQALVKPSDLAAFNASAPRTAPEPRQAQSGPIDPEPPFPARTVAPSAPIPVAIPLKAGDIHTQGHNPLRENNRGLYCPTKIDGEWCKWTTKAGR
jgi:hypothetical protein